MTDVLTVGKLREVIKDIPDEVQVELKSDTGVDQGEGKIVIETAYHKNCMKDGKKTEALVIYANDQF